VERIGKSNKGKEGKGYLIMVVQNMEGKVIAIPAATSFTIYTRHR
jgi:hypothetical protein